MTTIDCISDLHGYWPLLAGGDILVIAGDITARDEPQQWTAAYQWIKALDYKYKILVGGNHDKHLYRVSRNPAALAAYQALLRDSYGITYLCDTGTSAEGLKIWGSPWTVRFDGVDERVDAWMRRDETLAKRWELIPGDTDILVTHGPPYGIRDCVIQRYTGTAECCGSRTLLDAVQRVKPRIHVYGHIHEGYGSCELATWFINA